MFAVEKLIKRLVDFPELGASYECDEVEFTALRVMPIGRRQESRTGNRSITTRVTTMQTIAIREVDGHLAEFIDMLPPGEEIVLTRDDKAVATLRSASETPRRAPQFGTLKGTILYIAPDFDAIPEGFEEFLP
jgi:antitoxin (DNA-binding transcriptional repressor) of toxin-antitoxin stability system